MTNTSATETCTTTTASAGILGDSFGVSVLFLIGLTLAQRVIGLGRNVLFCGLLEDHELGRWSIANNFLGWVAPFVVLGIPGTFGRLAEHYRGKGQLRTYLIRSAVICALLVTASVTVHLFFPAAIAQIAFNDPTQVATVRMLGIVLVGVILMNFLTEFLTAVRLTRAVSLVHLTNSLSFTGLGVLLLLVLPWPSEESLIVAFGLSALAASAVGSVYMVRLWSSSSADTIPDPQRQFWKRVTSFATWIWCGNTIANLFDVSDQFVLKHYSNLPPETVDGMIGQLYASRIVPGLIVTVAVMIGCSLLPYLITDWEAGRKDDVRRRMNMVIKMAAIGFTMVAAMTHLVSPILFTWILRGKYDSGLHLMPVAFVQYTWFSLVAIGTKYFLCVDRSRLATLPLLVGLLSGVSLIGLLYPMWGLQGVVWATALGSAFALAALFGITRMCGMTWDRGTLLAAVFPVTMSLGGGVCLAITALLIVAGIRGNWLVNHDERMQLLDSIRGLWNQRILGWRATQRAAT